MQNSRALKGVFSVILVGGVCASTQAQVTKQGDAYLFRRKIAKGMAMSYSLRSSNKITGLPQNAQNAQLSNMVMVGGFALKIADVKGGKANISINTRPFTMNGKEVQKAVSSSFDMDARGAAGGAGAMQAKSNNLAFEYPEKPIRVGDKVNIFYAVQGADIKSNCRFVGFKTVKGKSAAVWTINLDLSKNLPNGKLNGIVNLLISMEDGWPLSTVVNLDGKGGADGKNIIIHSMTAVDRE